MKKPTRTYPITLESLATYQLAAMRNAVALVEEAQVLLKAEHYARAYFLAESAIEEAGKAAIAHFAKGRNLTAPGVQARLRIEFEDHGAKVRAAFFAYIIRLLNQDPKRLREELEPVFKTTSALLRGREGAMYADFRNDGSTYAPADVVRPTAARDCVRLALKCTFETTELVNGPAPTRFSTADDKWFELGPKQVKVWKEDDFGEYLLHYIEKHGAVFSMAEAVTTYHDAYLCRGRKFKPTRDEGGISYTAR